MRQHVSATLEDLKARGAEAVQETRRMIATLEETARASRRSVRDHRRALRRSSAAVFAIGAKS